MLKKAFIYLTFIVVASFPIMTLATNGYSAHGWGTQSKSMAGIGVASPLDGLNVATNPATAVHLGNRLDLGVALFSPHRGYTANNDGSPIGPPQGPATVKAGEFESDKNYFLIPYGAYHTLLDYQTSVGIAVGGNGGMNTRYPNAVFSAFNNPGGQASTPTGIDLMQLFIGIPYSKKLSPEHSIGIMPVFAIQAFKAYGLEPFKPFSLYPNKLTNNGNDTAYGMGLRLGWLGQFNERISLGLSYQSKVYMTEFEDYKGLFAESGDFDIPSTIVAGIAIKPTPSVSIELDLQHIRYSEVKSLGNPSDLAFMPGSILLGTDNGLGFGWDDMNIVKLGVQWKYSADMTLRAGYSQATQTIPSSQALFSILAPAVVTKHFTLGVGKKIGRDKEFNLSITYVPNEEVHGTNPNTGPQTGHVEMDQYEVEISWSKVW
jgi:long-chain fatty acid transport protein